MPQTVTVARRRLPVLTAAETILCRLNVGIDPSLLIEARARVIAAPVTAAPIG